MIDYNFSDILSSIAAVSSQRKYWMVRTMAGVYYADFIRHNYIAIGYNEISLQQLNNLPQSNKQAKEALKSLFADVYPENRNSGHSIGQLLRFARELQVGDVVIIPSESAMHVAIGIITSGMYEEEELSINVDNRCQFKKRMRVEWKSVSRRKYLSPSLQIMFVSRHTISDVSSYAPYIDSKISDCYLKNEEMNLVLRISTRKDVSVDDFFNLKALITLVDNFCEENNFDFTGEAITMKIQMESPGWLRLSCKSASKLLLFGLFLIAINGGGISYNSDDGLDIRMTGIMESISNYKDREADRMLLNAAIQSLDSLKIQNPNDLQPIIELMKVRNDIREKY